MVATKTSPQNATSPRNCPGLTVSRRGAIWTDSLGRQFNLETEKRLSTGEAAQQMHREIKWVLEQIAAVQLYPAIYFNQRCVEVYQCAINDYINRAISKTHVPALNGAARR